MPPMPPPMPPPALAAAAVAGSGGPSVIMHSLVITVDTDAASSAVRTTFKGSITPAFIMHPYSPVAAS